MREKKNLQLLAWFTGTPASAIGLAADSVTTCSLLLLITFLFGVTEPAALASNCCCCCCSNSLLLLDTPCCWWRRRRLALESLSLLLLLLLASLFCRFRPRRPPPSPSCCCCGWFLAVKDDMESDDPVFNEVTSFDIFSAHESSPPHSPKNKIHKISILRNKNQKKMSPPIHT